jgi:hypothetical protein
MCIVSIVHNVLTGTPREYGYSPAELRRNNCGAYSE